MTTQTPTTWPAGVIGRYLTVGGASVDITHDNPAPDAEPSLTTAHCTGCGRHMDHYWSTHVGRYDNGRTGAERAAREWAQTHAGHCRALPKPTA